MIENPILRGFCPDPSIIRVGEDYYIATSTFEWWPGVKLFHSRDLKYWEQIASPLRRESQLNLLGNPTSGGVWAPCLSYDGKYFYLIFTDVKTKKGRYYNTHNYMVYTEDIYGEWSEPVYLNSIGFDPSLFHDVDGRKYLINMINGFKGILVQELEPGTWKLVGERKLVYEGSDIGRTEGPHMYHIGDWYYLLVAEGGTGYEHCVTLARSRSIWGPFETAPNNPILTSNREDMGALQKCGHADFVETPDGEVYMVHLCSRPLGGQQWCTLGRETAIQKMRWNEDGWLELAGGGRFAENFVEEPGSQRAASSIIQDTDLVGVPVEGSIRDHGDSVEVLTKEYAKLSYARGALHVNRIFHADFSSKVLSVNFVSPRTSYESFVDLQSREGWLRMKGQESMNSLHKVSLLAVRQQEVLATASTTMEFAPDYMEQLAGLAYMYDAMNFYVLGVTATEEGGRVLTLIKSDTGIITDEIEPVELPKEGAISLCAQVVQDGMAVQFMYRLADDARGAVMEKAQVIEDAVTRYGQEPLDAMAGGMTKTWIPVGTPQTTQILTDEYCRGFTGAHFGLYVHDMTGLRYYADFQGFDVE